MKKVFLFIAPLFIAMIIFFGVLFFLDRKSGKGALQVTSAPRSQVYLDDKFIGETPLCRCELADMLAIGDYTVKLIPREGNFSPFEQKITVNKATLTAVDRTFGEGATSEGSIIDLTKINNKSEAQLLVVSFPDKANVFLDANLQGATPLLLDNVTASDHELSITKSGYKDKVVRISISLGYKLTSLVFLGINPVASASSAKEDIESIPTVQKIIILNTPTGFLRVRGDSSLSSAQIGEVYPDEEYDLLNEKEDWFEIKLKDGKSGWISSTYSKKK